MRLFLILAAIVLGADPARTEVLVYLLKGGSAKGTKIDDGVVSPWPGNTKGLDGYLILDLDGVDAANPEGQITRLGKTFYPFSADFNHKNKSKHLYGGTLPGIGYDVYGRPRDSKGRRIFTWLHLQRDGRTSENGARDSGAGVGQGTASWMDIGTGRPGYYAPRLSFQIWRLDAGFSGTFAGSQDGRQTKYTSAPLLLDLASTRAINLANLGKADAAIWLIENLFPSYTELPPDVEGE